MTATTQDRERVTPTSFGVDPSLVGLRLASPWRRLLAIMIDGLAIAILSNAPSVVLGIAAASVMLRASAGTPTGGVVRRSTRYAMRFGAAGLLVVVIVALWNRFTDDPPVEVITTSDSEASAMVGVELSGRPGMLAGREMALFALADDAVEAQERADRLHARLQEAGVDDGEISRIMEAIGKGREDRPWIAAAANSFRERSDAAEEELARTIATRMAAAEQLVPLYAEALESGATDSAAALRASIVTDLAADTIEHLAAALERQRTQSAELAARLEETSEDLDEARNAGIRGAFGNIREDLGVGLGWSGLYFTALTVLWRGQTLGKRLLRIRVVRLDGIPLGWWAAFERFGGYAAGFVTGLLGFLQVFWDRNRQAVQDKISETVVVSEA